MTNQQGGLAVETDGIVKRFGKTTALDGLDLAVPVGGVYGVLGPNGAGKSTALRILATLAKPSEGTGRVFGHDLVADPQGVRSRVSLTGQVSSVDDDLTGSENLQLMGRLLGYRGRDLNERVQSLLSAFGLENAAGRQVKKYSGGMARRLDIAASILVVPDLLFLDEPTVGLDPRSRNDVWEIIRTVVERGTTVMLTTQYLEEADRLADRIAVIDQGRVIAEGTPAELKASVGGGSIHVRIKDPGRLDQAHQIAASRVHSGRVEVVDGNLVIQIAATDSDGAASQAGDLLDALARAHVPVSDFSLGQPSLDEVFLALTDHPAEQAPTPKEEAA